MKCTTAFAVIALLVVPLLMPGCDLEKGFALCDEGVEKAVENVRPFIGARDGRGLNPDAIIQLNRALGKVGEWTGTLALTEQKCR